MFFKVAMTDKQIKDIILAGENEQVEFKTSFSKTVGECLVAFANTKGGKVLIGIDDAGSVVGTSTAKESLQKWVNEIKQNTEPAIIPDVEAVKTGNRIVIIIRYRSSHSNRLLSEADIIGVYIMLTIYFHCLK